MAASLTLRDIGEDRKRALEAEARARGVPVAEVVRGLIDEGLARARAERARAEWIEAARPGLADEARHLEAHGPLLARFRQVGPTPE
jgi:post-segregation antitoxin (ccd killing protein)